MSLCCTALFARFKASKVFRQTTPKPSPESRTNEFLADILDNYNEAYSYGSMTCSVYDTAWVASISKTVGGCQQWLLPMSFSYILSAQLPDGGWPAHLGSPDTDLVDGLLSTLAALFCLNLHAEKPLQLQCDDIDIRIKDGSKRLESLLQLWDVGNCDSVGFEILVPSLLELLEEQGLSYEFPGRELLFGIRAQKLSKLTPEVLYTA